MSGQGVMVEPRRMWGGRFEAGPSGAMDALNRSLPVDRRMWREDIEGSRAWAAALERAGVLAEGELPTMLDGLGRVAVRLETWDETDWAAAPDEDVHSLVERLLGEEIGALAGKLHTGRSRNDQVATDSRLWAMRALDALDGWLDDLQQALLEQAERHVDTIMPAYTHLQRAQPVSAGHWLMSHHSALARDRDRLLDARRRLAVLPLGSGAISGCAFPIDREFLKDALGFDAVSSNSMDAVADRDWAAELLFIAAMVGVHLSRLAEDVVLYASSEFAFVRLSDGYSTGSSLMPQKRNPDAMELARAKSGRLTGELTALLTLLKGLPSGYNKDLQEDKTSLFAAFDTLAALLPAVTGTIATMSIDVERCASAVDATMLATDAAEALVRAGIPFREAHERIGTLVRAAERLGCPLDALPADELRRHVPADVDWNSAFDPAASIARRGIAGGTAPESVRAQIRMARASH